MNKSKRVLNGGVVGYGGAFNMGAHHANCMKEAGFNFAAACDIDPKRTVQAKKDFPSIKVYNDVAKFAADPDIDLAVVILPHNLHAPVARKLLAAKKHVIVEKPFTITSGEATDLINLARKNKRMLSVFHNRRWDTDFVTIKKAVDSGLIGKVFQLEFTMASYGHPGYWWRSDKKISGGALYDWGAHLLDWTLNLIKAPVESVYGNFQKRVWKDITNEDHVQTIVNFKNKAKAIIEISSIASVPRQMWRILGTGGGIGCNGFENIPISVTSFCDGRNWVTQVPKEKVGPNPYYRNIAAHLYRGAKLEITAEHARRIIEIITSAEKSSKTGKLVRVKYN